MPSRNPENHLAGAVSFRVFGRFYQWRMQNVELRIKVQISFADLILIKCAGAFVPIILHCPFSILN